MYLSMFVCADLHGVCQCVRVSYYFLLVAVKFYEVIL